MYIVQKGETPLNQALEYGNLSTCKFLVANGHPVNLCDNVCICACFFHEIKVKKSKDVKGRVLNDDKYFCAKLELDTF